MPEASNLPGRLSYEVIASGPSLVKRDDFSDAVEKGKDLWALLQVHCDKEVVEPSLAKLKGMRFPSRQSHSSTLTANVTLLTFRKHIQVN